MLVGKSNFWSRGIKLFICSSIFSYKKHFVGATHHVLDLGKGLFQNNEKNKVSCSQGIRIAIRCDLNYLSEKCEKWKQNKVNLFVCFFNFVEFISTKSTVFPQIVSTETILFRTRKILNFQIVVTIIFTLCNENLNTFLTK